MSTVTQKQFRYRVAYKGTSRFVNAGAPMEAIDQLRAILLAKPLQPGEEPDADLGSREAFRKLAGAKVSMRG